MQRMQQIREAYLAPADPTNNMIATSPQGVALVFAGVELEFRHQLGDAYLEHFHVLLANSGTTRVLFLDAPAHPSHVDSCSNFNTKVWKDTFEPLVQKKIKALKEEQQPFVIMMMAEEDYLVLYRKKLLAYIQQLKHWPLELVPGKIMRRMMKMMPDPQPMRCNWTLQMTLMGYFNTVTMAQSEECANCGSNGDGVTLRSCAQCMKVQYCGRECQRAHWLEEHKTMCPLYKQMQSESQLVSMSISTGSDFAHFIAAHRVSLLGE